MIDEEHITNVGACGMACILLMYLWYNIWNAIGIQQYSIDLWDIL